MNIPKMADSSSKVVRYITIDEMLTYIGEFELFQWLLEILFCSLLIPQTYPILVMYFAALSPTWQCVENNTYCNVSGTFPSDNNARCSLPRESWMYTEPNDFSIVTGDKEWQIHLTTSIFFASWSIGAIVIGWLADNYGRKKVIFSSSGAILIISFATSFSPNVYWFIAGRAIVGFFITGGLVQEYILISELVGGHYRPKAGAIFWLAMASAYLVLGLQAYFIRKWKTLFMALSAPYIFLLAFYKFVPESVRWLRLHGTTDEVLEVLKRIALWNKKDIPSDVKIIVEEETQHKSSPLDLFKTRKLAIKTLILSYVWLVNSMLFYGLALVSSEFGGSVYINFVIIAFAEVPGIFAATYFCGKIGRKKTIIISMFFGSLACICLAFVQFTENNTITKVCLGIIGKLFMTISYNSLYTWSVEIFPTTLRSKGMGIMQTTGSIGAACSPWVAKFLKVCHHSVPFIVMGSLTLIGCGLAIPLPETRGVATAETTDCASSKHVREIENAAYEHDKC